MRRLISTLSLCHMGVIFKANSPKSTKSTKNPIARLCFQRNRKVDMHSEIAILLQIAGSVMALTGILMCTILLIMFSPRQHTVLSKQVQIACYIALSEMEHIKLFKYLYMYQVTILYLNLVAMETF